MANRVFYAPSRMLSTLLPVSRDYFVTNLNHIVSSIVILVCLSKIYGLFKQPNAIVTH